MGIKYFVECDHCNKTLKLDETYYRTEIKSKENIIRIEGSEYTGNEQGRHLMYLCKDCVEKFEDVILRFLKGK